jgi:tetratricopeptide (TPR) repeat protein
MASERLQKLLSFLKNSPNDSFINFAIAKEYESLGDDKNAMKYYLQLVENDEMYVGTYYHLGKLYEKMDDAEKAFSTYKQGMEIAKSLGDQHAFNELAGAKLNLGDDEDFE